MFVGYKIYSCTCKTGVGYHICSQLQSMSVSDVIDCKTCCWLKHLLLQKEDVACFTKMQLIEEKLFIAPFLLCQAQAALCQDHFQPLDSPECPENIDNFQRVCGLSVGILLVINPAGYLDNAKRFVTWITAWHCESSWWTKSLPAKHENKPSSSLWAKVWYRM